MDITQESNQVESTIHQSKDPPPTDPNTEKHLTGPTLNWDGKPMYPLG
jgi:hypothetical protein